jgi:hypothetical protein
MANHAITFHSREFSPGGGEPFPVQATTLGGNWRAGSLNVMQHIMSDCWQNHCRITTAKNKRSSLLMQEYGRSWQTADSVHQCKGRFYAGRCHCGRQPAEEVMRHAADLW